MLLLTMVYLTTYAFLKPYRSFYINVLEVFTLVDIMLQLTITSTDQFRVTVTNDAMLFAILCLIVQDPIFKEEGDFRNLTDECGKINNLNEHATILIPFYYLPLLIPILLIVKMIGTKVYAKKRLVYMHSIYSYTHTNTHLSHTFMYTHAFKHKRARKRMHTQSKYCSYVASCCLHDHTCLVKVGYYIIM